MVKRLFPHPWLSLALLAIWLLLANGVSPANWALGAFFAWAIALRVGSRLWLHPMRLARPGLMLRLAVHVLIDIVVANVEVALLVLGPASRMRPSFIQVPIEVEHELALTALISIVSLTPGTLCAELSDDRRRLLLHVLDLDDEARLIALIKSRYEAPLREIFECLPS